MNTLKKKNRLTKNRSRGNSIRVGITGCVRIGTGYCKRRKSWKKEEWKRVQDGESWDLKWRNDERNEARGRKSRRRREEQPQKV